MKIEPFHLKKRYLNQAITDLRELLVQPTDKQLRPCGECRVACTCQRRSTVCCCGCSERCPYIGSQLTSDPNFIIESKILPLVYALNLFRVIQTCWSCEGHNRPNGETWKMPEVWFYSGSAWYANLISEYLNTLFLRKRVRYQWVVTVCPHFHPGELSYSLKPDVNQDHPADLAVLQQDIATLSKDLYEDVMKNSRQRLAELEKMKV